MRLRSPILGVAVVMTLAFTAQSVHAESPALAYLNGNGIIPAVDFGNPDDPVTRAGGLKIILDAREDSRARVQSFREHRPSLPLFVDAPSSGWFSPYAEAGYEAGVVTGFPDRMFRPSQWVQVEEVVVMLMRAYGHQPQASAADREWFAPFIREALQRNVIAHPRSMAVGQTITRGQLFDMVYRMEVLRRDNLVAFRDPSAATAEGPTAGASADVASAQIAADPSVDPVFVAAPSSDPDVVRQYASPQDFAITIPSLGITDLTVTHPEDTLSKQGLLDVLKDGVGHLFSYPGKGGKIMVYGHSSGYSWDVSQYTKIFRQVNKLKPGERVYVTYQGHVYAYSVTGQQTIAPNDIRPFTGDGEELILYTCWPVGSNKSRLIVKAVPVETVAMR